MGQIRKANEFGIKIVLMLGGAGGGYHSLFDNYPVYNLLYHLLKNKLYISGVDFDIEEEVELDDVKTYK